MLSIQWVKLRKKIDGNGWGSGPIQELDSLHPSRQDSNWTLDKVDWACREAISSEACGNNYSGV
ncbi:hypothetical protein CCP3SC15_1650003 [Gammaproteobacteria bacterium]